MPEGVLIMVVYRTLKEVPSWGRETVEKLIAKGLINGTGDGLYLEHNMLRCLVINDRAGLYDYVEYYVTK